MDFRQAYDPVRALGVSWRLLRHALLTVFLGALLVVGSEVDNQFQYVRPPWDWTSNLRGALWAIPSWIWCTGVVSFLFNCLLRIGFAGAVQRVMATGEERFRDLFQDRGLWLTMVLTRLLKMSLLVVAGLPFVILIQGPIFAASYANMESLGVVAGIVFALAYAPIWCFVVLGFVLAEQAVAIERKGPVEAIQRSWDLAEGNRLQLLGYSLILLVVQFSGVLLCGVGLLVTAPWAATARFESYLRFALPDEECAAWVDAQQG